MQGSTLSLGGSCVAGKTWNADVDNYELKIREIGQQYIREETKSSKKTSSNQSKLAPISRETNFDHHFKVLDKDNHKSHIYKRYARYSENGYKPYPKNNIRIDNRPRIPKQPNVSVSIGDIKIGGSTAQGIFSRGAVHQHHSRSRQEGLFNFNRPKMPRSNNRGKGCFMPNYSTNRSSFFLNVDSSHSSSFYYGKVNSINSDDILIVYLMILPGFVIYYIAKKITKLKLTRPRKFIKSIYSARK